MSFGRFLRLSFCLSFTVCLVLSAELRAATVTVTSTGDDANTVDGSVSLREAIASIDNGANLNGDVVATGTYGVNDTIDFNLGSGNPSIAVGATTSLPLPDITVAVTIDGNTGGATRVVLDGGNAGAGADGLSISGAGNVTIRGFVIQNFSGNGIRIDGCDGNIVQGNFIGTDANGSSAQPNAQHGVFILDGASNNQIGGTSAAERNLISGNGFCGIVVGTGSLQNSTANVIQGNFVGTDASGDAALGNDCGIDISGEAGNQIGGSAPGAGNVISGNRNTSGGAAGVRIFNKTATDNVVEGNLIGIGVSGAALGNGGDGVTLGQGSSNNTIGGTNSGSGNTIAFNLRHGIEIDSGTGNAILGNAIFSNTNLGIDLGFDFSVNPNDAGDGDTGANNLQNFPDLSSAVSSNGSIEIKAAFNSTAGGSFRVEFFANDACDDSGNGEGQSFLGFADVVADASGNAAIDASFSAALSGVKFITATATDNATQYTSEFSKCFQANILVEDCTNGTDDDGDALVDCQDPDCVSDPACAPSGAEICNNGVDDDADGLVDCGDPDCATNAICVARDLEGGGCSLGVGPDSGTASAVLLLPLLGLLGFWLKQRRQ